MKGAPHLLPRGSVVVGRGRLVLVLRPRAVLAGLLLLAVALILGLFLLRTGTVTLSPGQIFAGILGQAEDPVVNRVTQGIRLPRLLTAALAGAALGMAGAVFQSLSRNPLGSPDVIGFTTGAATGAITQIILFGGGGAQTAAAAVSGGVITALVVLALAGGRLRDGGYRLILIGVGTGAILSGLNTLLLVKGNLDQAMSAQIWLAGSLNARTWSHVWTVLAGLALFAPVILLCGRRMQILELGEDMAEQLGLGIGRLRLVLILAAVGLSSVATAACGPVSFIALAGPQLARRLSRSPEVPVLTGALAGTVLLLAADVLSQSAPFALAMPIGLTTGLLGGLYLLLVVSRRRN